MKDQIVIKHIRTKKKIRRIVTYASPDCQIKKGHEKILAFIRANTYPSKFAKAYISNRGIFENAKAHMYNDIFLKMDIKNFFDNINHEKLVSQLLWEINKHKYISRKTCYLIVKICTLGFDGLPLGLITSPDLANLYLKKFDSLLYGKLKTYPVKDVIYTRYADDLTISFKYNDDYENIIDQMRADVIDYLEEFYLEINEKKTSIVNLMNTNHVRITGVSIVKLEDNYRRISVGKKLKNEVFWKAIELFDTPLNDRNEEEVKRIKGMMSFILSIEKQGISYTYSRNMRQLVYDRGYRNLPELVRHL